MHSLKHVLSVSFIGLYVTAASIPSLLSAVESWEQLGPAGGQLQSVLTHPLDPNMIYAGTSSGLWRSADAGSTWSVPSGIRAPALISDIAVDPKRPDIVYVTSQFGLYESLDRGVTWSRVETGISTGFLTSVAINPSNSDTIYLSSRDSGIFKTTDRGKSWLPFNTGLTETRAKQVYDLAIDPKAPATLYIGTGSFVYKSTNGGESWTQTTQGLVTILPYIFTVAIDPSVSSTVYVGIHGGGVAKSTNAGASWTQINEGLTLLGCDALAVDPQNSSMLYLGNQHGVFKSTNGGTNWAPAGSGMPTNYVNDLFLSPQNRSVVYGASSTGLFKSTNQAGSWDLLPLPAAPVRTLAVGGPGSPVVYAGVYYGGIFKSVDQGKSWVSVSNGITDRPVYAVNSTIKSIAVDTKSTTRAFVGLDGGGVYRTTNGGSSWVEVNSGLTNKKVQTLVMSPSDSNTLLAGTSSNGVFRSQNGAESWSSVNSGMSSNSVIALVFGQQDSTVVYAGTGNGVFVSSNTGSSWSDISSGLTSTQVRTIAVDPEDNRTLFVGTYNGLDRTTDGGLTWRQVFDRGVSAILIDPTLPSAIIIADTEGRILRSTDRGLNWEDLKIEGPPVKVNALTLSSLDRRTLFVGTEGASIQSITQDRLLSLWFPYYRYDPVVSTGFAVSNYSDETADLTFESFSTTGDLAPLPSNPSSKSVAARSQLAQMGHELFQATPTQAQTAWIHLASDNPEIGGFFQVVGSSQLDGSVAFRSGSTQLYFTRIFEGPTAYRGQSAKTRLSVANIGDESTVVYLNLIGSDQSKSKSYTIPAKGLLSGTLTELFGGNLNSGAGSYVSVRAASQVPLIGFGLVQLDSIKTIIGLNASPMNESTRMYSAQLASLSGFFTSLKLVNTDWDTRTVTIHAVNEAGQEISPPVTISIESEAAFESDAEAIFGWKTASINIGSMWIEIDGPGVVGDVVFGDGKSFKYAAALPLQTQLLQEAVFSQVANGLGLYTGLAFYNPNNVAADVTLEVYAATGTRTGITNQPIRLEPNSRISRTLEELLPSTTGQIRGYIVVKSTQPLIVQQLFGDLGLNLLSAVPPTIVK